MKNCVVSLDVIWLDEQLHVVHLARELVPCPRQGPCPTTIPASPARYVIEVAAGTAAREKLVVGDRIAVVAEPPLE
jgi:uncharacterized membrane protein (UPF0127 family)